MARVSNTHGIVLIEEGKDAIDLATAIIEHEDANVLQGKMITLCCANPVYQSSGQRLCDEFLDFLIQQKYCTHQETKQLSIRWCLFSTLLHD